MAANSIGAVDIILSSRETAGKERARRGDPGIPGPEFACLRAKDHAGGMTMTGMFAIDGRDAGSAPATGPRYRPLGAVYALRLLLVAAAVTIASDASAQDWPTQPVKVVVPYGP